MASIDWRTICMLPPRRRFSAEELRLALPGGGRLNPAQRWALVGNLGLPLATLMIVDGSDNPPSYLLSLLSLVALLGTLGILAWRDPSRPLVRYVYYSLPLLLLGTMFALKRAGVARDSLFGLTLVAVSGALGVWFAMIFRHQYIEGRLTELAERARSIEMARRLSAAQVEPHFLFNTLASLQHWVQTKDERAAPMLDSLVGYLRATLPMFERPLHPAADELNAVRRYLEVMQARFGNRLRFSIDVPDALLDLPLPPGLLLTLAENAVEHGIEPRVGGGTLRLSARREGDDAVLEVIDDGPGPPTDADEGVGLANSRERLALVHGEAASLKLAAGPAGGCIATVRIHWRPA